MILQKIIAIRCEVMKKALCIIIAILMAVSLMGCQGKSNDKDKYEPVLVAPSGDYEHQLFGKCFIYCFDNNYTLEYNNVDIAEGTFYKYAAYDDRFVAVHNMELSEDNGESENKKTVLLNDIEFGVDKDNFILYDSKNNDLKYFNNIESFNEYCRKMSIVFDKWQYRDCESNRININDNCYIENVGKYRGQYLYVNDMPMFEGIIKSYSVLGNDEIAINLQLADFDYGPEFLSCTNKDLNLEKYSVSKKYRYSGILCFDVYYESYIVVNTKDGKFIEYNSKDDFTDKSEWMDI